MIRLAWVAILILVSGCSSKVVLTDLEYSFRLLISAVEQSLPGGAYSQSANSREWVSHYFTFTDNKVTPVKSTDSVPERCQAEVQILGDRRPYKVVVLVRREAADGKQGARPLYDSAGTHSEAASAIASQVEAYLAQSRERRDLIDEFRAF